MFLGDEEFLGRGLNGARGDAVDPDSLADMVSRTPRDRADRKSGTVTGRSSAAAPALVLPGGVTAALMNTSL